MASIRARQQRSGAVTYAVLWRDRDTGKQTSMPFPNRQGAENFRRMVEANRGSLAPAMAMLTAASIKSPPLALILSKHIDGLAGVSARTRADYRRDAQLHITPHLGHIPVAALTAQQVRDWLQLLESGDLSDKTIANVHGLLSSAVASAVEAGHRGDNPVRGARLTRRKAHERQEMVCLTPDEWRAVDAAVAQFDNGCYQLALRVLAGTGMRWGEMAALQVGDLNLDGKPRPTISIRRAVKRDNQSRYYVGPTKTKAGQRTVSISPGLAEQLRAHVAGRKPGDRVFSSPEGSLLNPGHARARVWVRAVEASGIAKRPRIHDLRHSHASWLFAKNVDPLTIQRRLGHESILTTTGVYAHLMPSQQESAADAIADVLG